MEPEPKYKTWRGNEIKRKNKEPANEIKIIMEREIHEKTMDEEIKNRKEPTIQLKDFHGRKETKIY